MISIILFIKSINCFYIKFADQKYFLENISPLKKIVIKTNYIFLNVTKIQIMQKRQKMLHFFSYQAAVIIETVGSLTFKLRQFQITLS
jgi:hypothetical protein